MLIVLGTIIGAVLGSFATALGTRVYRDEALTMTRGRSKCPHCGTQLEWFDLVPIFSFIFLRGQCRHCGELIPSAYLITELIGAGAGGLVGLHAITSTDTIGVWALLVLLLAIIFIDLRWQVVPDLLIIASAAVTILVILDHSQGIISSLAGATIAATPLWLLVHYSRERVMGMGDVMLALVLGGLVGPTGALSGLLASFILGGAFGGWLLITKRAHLKTQLAFTPFLICGFLLVYLIGGKLS